MCARQARCTLLNDACIQAYDAVTASVTISEVTDVSETLYLHLQSSITNLLPKSAALYADWISVWVISLFIYWVSVRCSWHVVCVMI